MKPTSLVCLKEVELLGVSGERMSDRELLVLARSVIDDMEHDRRKKKQPSRRDIIAWNKVRRWIDRRLRA